MVEALESFQKEWFRNARNKTPLNLYQVVHIVKAV